jgi:hypothetical protein
MRANTLSALEPGAVAALSPYIRSHINRFGLYAFDLDRRPPAVDYDAFDLDRRPPAVDYDLPIFSNGTTSAVAITT